MSEDSKQPRIQKLTFPLKDSTVATFFIVVNPGFEVQAEREAEQILDADRIVVVNGGIQFDSTWGAVRRGQPNLKIASRVLVRVDQFGARDFQKLFRKVANLPWEEWLKPKVGLSVRAASHTSRLRIKSGIEESVVEAFKKSFKAPPPRPVKEVMCLVRVEDDICTISLDLSGDLLHKRGSHTDVGAAPLRETWAASIVDRVFEIATTDEKMRNAFSKKWQWIEPMAGTAVFLREALSISMKPMGQKTTAQQPTAETPSREFAIDTCFKFEKDNDELKEKPKAKKILVENKSQNVQTLVQGLSDAVIVDRDEAQLERGRKALAGYKGNFVAHFILADQVKSTLGNSAKPKALPRMVFVNPPWGQRLKGPDATDSADGQTRLMANIEKTWQPTLVAIIFPRIAGVKAKVPKGWTEQLPLDFRAGGIPVKARFFTIERGSASV